MKAVCIIFKYTYEGSINLINTCTHIILHSKDCQVQHWKQHKARCTAIKKRHDDWKEDWNITLPDGSALDTKEGPCAICLEETITNPVVLPCGHEFCFDCVGQYQYASESEEVSCPYCRGEIPDVVDSATERTKLYLDRAYASPKGSEERKKYASLAFAEHDSIMEILNIDEGQELQIETLHAKASMLALMDKPEETVLMTKKILSLNKARPGAMDFDEVSGVKTIQAEAYCACGEWDKAESIYMSLLEEGIERDRTPDAGTVIGTCQTFYETQRYDDAIKVGNIDYERFRFAPGIHKYVALSQKAKGDVVGAKETISRAILYEKHWDKDNLQKNMQILRELSSSDGT